MAVFLTPLSVAGTAIALPAIAQDLGSDQLGLQWAVNGFNFAFAVFTIAAGVFADRFGYRLTFVIGLVVVLASSTVSGLAPTLLVLDVGRFLGGVGSAGIIAGGSAAMSHAYPSGPARARTFALFGTTVGIGLALGPSIMGGLVASVGWRGVYAVLGLAALVVLVVSAALPRAHPQREPRQTAMDFALLRNRRFLAFCLVPLAPAVGYVTILTYLPVATAAMFGMTAADAGTFMLPMTIPVFVGPLLAAHLVRRVRWIRPETIIYASLAALIIGDLGLLLLSPGVALAWLIMPLALVGFGYGFPMGLIDGEAISSVPVRSSGTAVGVLNFLRTGSAAIAVGGYGMVMAALISYSLPPATAARVAAGGVGHADVYAAAFRTTLIAMALVVAVLCLIIVWLHRTAAAGRRARSSCLRCTAKSLSSPASTEEKTL
ncbi:MFS transporter [Acrocarpospora sp. B8E8]|uniref:MFS transporter n=1 Tax=Acrocarpospora sp. B8E8 TaxID=3153572 RepID=UPI00325FD9E0